MQVRGEQRPWLNGRRIRAHALLLAVCLWTAYGFVMATPGMRDRNGLSKGTDFLHFYTLGLLAQQHRGELLYDMRAQAELTGKVMAEARFVYVPLYGPQCSLLFAPLAFLPYGWALAVWLLFNVLLYLACCYAIWKTCPNLRNDSWTVLVVALAFPGFFHLLLWGQSSGLALGFFTLAYLALSSGRHFLAGLAIGCLIFKPQLGLAAAVVFVVSQQWAVVGGALAAAAAQLSLGWMYYGTQAMRDYWRALTHFREVLGLLEPRPYQMHSLRGFWVLLVPSEQAVWLLYALSAIAILIILVRCWRSELPLGVRFAGLLVATVLVAPHLTVYDLVVLAPSFLLLADWLAATEVPYAGFLLYLCFPLFLLGPLARFTHLQLSVIALVALLWTIGRDPGQRSTAI